jgi:hypothetical protein
MAHKEFFGDAYQYAHRVLLDLALPAYDPEGWIVHPMMFRNNGGGLDIGAYAGFLGVDEETVLDRDGNGRRLDSPILPEHVAHRPGANVFLDPDTGINFGNGGQKHVGARRLAQIANQEGRRIVMVFDHAYRRERITVAYRTHEGLRIHNGVCPVPPDDDGFDVLCGPCRAVEQVHRKLVRLWNEPHLRLHCAAVIVRASPCVCYVIVSTECTQVQATMNRIYGQVPVPGWFRVDCPCLG